jgi:hypothetical protein
MQRENRIRRRNAKHKRISQMANGVNNCPDRIIFNTKTIRNSTNVGMDSDKIRN